MKTKMQNYHSSSAYKNSSAEAEFKTDKKIAALMFQTKLSNPLNPLGSNNPLKKSDVKITGFR